MATKHITVKIGQGLRLPWATPPEVGQVIGTVRQGQAFGFLVRLPDGSYVQVNGSQTRRLNPFRIRIAVRYALGIHETRSAIASATQARSASQQTVVVIRKKRRTPAAHAAPGMAITAEELAA